MGGSIFQDIGRDYCDPEGVDPHFRLRSLKETYWAGFPTEFNVTYQQKCLSVPVWYAHLGLLKLCKHYDFHYVLDLGSNEGIEARIFDHLGKECIACEPNHHIKAALPEQYNVRLPDIQRNYEEVHFSKKFDAIWCSHVLEHIRNPGHFLDKIYDDLQYGGVLAISVPFNDFCDISLTGICMGHINKYNQWLLLYQLICAGFDCKEASFAIYAGQITVIVRKVPNNTIRSSTALFSPFPPEQRYPPEPTSSIEPRIYDFFPIEWNGTGFDNSTAFLNWKNPI